MHKLKCNKCQKTKATVLFYKSNTRNKGYSSQCKECIRNDKKRKDKSKLWASENRQKKRATYSKWRNNNLEKKVAHSAVYYALQTGKLFHEHCMVCGNFKAEAHHEDYSKPLEVMWLCKEHHSDIHSEAAA